MSKEIPVLPEFVIEDFLNTVEFKAEWVLMNCTDKEALYAQWSSALDEIMAIPTYTERAQHLSQYLDTLFHGNPFTE